MSRSARCCSPSSNASSRGTGSDACKVEASISSKRPSLEKFAHVESCFSSRCSLRFRPAASSGRRRSIGQLTGKTNADVLVRVVVSHGLRVLEVKFWTTSVGKGSRGVEGDAWFAFEKSRGLRTLSISIVEGWMASQLIPYCTDVGIVMHAEVSGIQILSVHVCLCLVVRAASLLFVFLSSFP